MPGELRLTLLGKPHASEGGVPVANLVYNKAQALLCYLAVTGRPHSRESLAGLLWGEMTEEHARANLRKVLGDLRQAVPEHLIITRQTIALDCEAPYWLDVEVFQAKLQSLRAAGEPIIFNESEARLLAEAVDLYSGDFMDGFYVRDAPAFEEWVVLQRERLRQLALHALYSLARFFTGRGSYASGIDYTTRLLALEPWHEEFHQQMMLLLALSGQRSAALRQYEVCRNVLDHELGVEPAADTLLLLRQIQAGQLAGPALPVLPPHNLAAPVTTFVGRQEELRLIGDRLGQPDCRLLTLVGIGGVGKTRLALTAASNVLASFADGVFVVDMSPTGTPRQLVASMREALEITCDVRLSARECLLDHLRSKQMLIVLDDVDRLSDAPGTLVQILARAPGVKILATAWERLNLPGEWVLPVRGLDYPRGAAFDDAENHAAVRLFVAGAVRAQADFVLSKLELPAVVRICQLVEGLPLAIELAATWVRVLSCNEIVQEIINNIDFLATTSHSVPERQRSLRAVFDYSWQQLNEGERDAFKRMSVFRGGFRREAAEQVAGASLPVLAALRDRCLLQSNSLGRYDIHGFLRQYCAEKLVENPGEQWLAHERYCTYYTTFLHKRETQLRMLHLREAVDEIAVELENIKAAWMWASSGFPLEQTEECPELATEEVQFRERVEGVKSRFLAVLAHLRPLLRAMGDPGKPVEMLLESSIQVDNGLMGQSGSIA